MSLGLVKIASMCEKIEETYVMEEELTLKRIKTKISVSSSSKVSDNIILSDKKSYGSSSSKDHFGMLGLRKRNSDLDEELVPY